MKDLFDKDNQWLVYELRVCRTALGITQKDLAELAGMALDSIKRLERKGSEPRYSSLIKLRRIFNHLGIRCHIDDQGKTTIEMRPSLVRALNLGTHTKYVSKRKESLDIDAPLEPFYEEQKTCK